MESRILIVKIGGNIINDDSRLTAFLQDFAAIDQAKILVHGGGNMASKLSKRLNIPIVMNEGRRITSGENLDVVTMVYAGLINKRISARLQALSCNAIGLCGSDGNSIKATKRNTKPIDFGWVGDVDEVNAGLIQSLIDNKMVPVFSAICHDGNGQLLNTNADTIAAEIAIAMSQHSRTELIYCFEKKGVLQRINDDNSVIENINLKLYNDLKKDTIISEGMLPKLENCFHALHHKVGVVKIGDMNLLGNIKSLHTTITL